MNSFGIKLCRHLYILVLLGNFYAVNAQEHLDVSANLKNFPVEDYFQNAQIHSVTMDSRGLVYFALAEGIVEFDGVEWRMISITDNAEINALAVNKDGRIYGGGHQQMGYLYVDDGGNTKFQSILELSDEVYNDTVIDIYTTSNSIYFVGLKTLMLYKNNELTKIGEGAFESAGEISGSFIVSDQEKGLLYLDNKQNLLPLNIPQSIRASKMAGLSDSSLIISTRSAGLFKIDVIADQFSLSPWKPSDFEKFSNISISSIDVIEGKAIAFGTYQTGIIITDYQGNVMAHHNQKNGLLNDNVFDVLFSSNSTLWASLYEGVSLITIPAEISGVTPEKSPAEKAIAKVDTIAFEPSAFSKVKDLYQSTIGKWLSFGRPKQPSLSTPANSESFASIIRKVEYIPTDSLIFGGAYSRTKNGVQILDQSDSSNYEFSYEYNAFRFSYTTNDFEDIEALEYQVKLEGLDRDWSTWTNNTYREYTNLDWGNYTFLVQARNSEGNFSRQAAFSFSIDAPWYESTWFYFLQFSVIMMALVVSGILNKTGRFISLSEALIAVVVIVIFQYVDLYIEPYLDEYSNDIAIFKIGISIIFGFSLEYIEELFHKTVARLTGLSPEQQEIKAQEIQEQSEQLQITNN